MKLNELLNTDAKIRVVADTDKTFGTSVEVGGREIDFTANYSDIGRWEVEFSEDGHRYSMTKSGKEFEVMAAVKKSFEMLIKKHPDDEFVFAADKTEKSRITAYERLLKRFVPDGYLFKKIDRTKWGDEMPLALFLISKK